MARLEFPFDSANSSLTSWSTTEFDYKEELKDLFNWSSVAVNTIAVQWHNSTSVDTEVTVKSLVTATEKVEALRSEAAADSTFSLGGAKVLSISHLLHLDSLGDAITYISPNIGSTLLGNTTKVKITGESSDRELLLEHTNKE